MAQLYQVTCKQCRGDGMYLNEEDGFGPVHWRVCYECSGEGYHLLDAFDYIEYVNQEVAEAMRIDQEMMS